MKRIILVIFTLGIVFSSYAQRVYINPGHGDWGPNSRPMWTVNHVAGDTLGFYESNTNLWKAFALNEKLVAAGYTTLMSRTENGPYPYVEKDESIDKPLLDIVEEVNNFEADYFISIHSNASADGDGVNFPLFIHSGYDGVGWYDERNMAIAAWPRHFEAFGNDKDHTNITKGFEPNSAYAENEENVRGSISFYGSNLSVLLHSYQGYLVEGYFHTYQPARHRALNPEWCRQEGIRYFRGIQDYYKKSGEEVGYIMGCVRSLTEMSHDLYSSISSSYDEFLPINGAKVVLRDPQGNIIRTECYRHVARHLSDQYYYTTDNNRNGIFVFENLAPGIYTLTVHAAGYQDKEMEVTVTADKTVYPEIFLEKGQGTEPQINVDVTWVLNGGAVDGTLPQAITGSAYTLPTPIRAGYTFLGWYDNAEGTGTALTTLPVGYKGTIYAIWESTSVKWELNGGVVYPYNEWLWEDFQKNALGRTSFVSIENALEVINSIGGETIYNYLTQDEYKWLGDYLWNNASGVDQGLDVYARWGIWLNTFLKCTTYTINSITLDFTEAGKPKVWREFAKGRGADSRFYSPIILPETITTDYTIPTPEKEGYVFQGWNTQPNGKGTVLTTLTAGYNGTVYAIWEKAPATTVTWELNGGHVYPSNDWLWQDFLATFNNVYNNLFTTRPTTYEEFSSKWGDNSKTYCNIFIRDNCSTDRYYWLGDYLWKKAETASQGNIFGGNESWGKLIWACLNCTTCTLTGHNTNTGELQFTVDFSEAGQPKSWRKYAEENKDTKEKISPDFYTEMILPTTIAVDYTIPSPEKEGYTFQGWYDNPKGDGDPITVLKAGTTGTIYAIWQESVPCIVAYDLHCKYLQGKMAFEFSFYANTQPSAGKLIFYNKDKEPIGEYAINYLWKGRNTVVLNAEDIPALGELIIGRDFMWEVHLEARPSTLFAEIFRCSKPFNTAYATIDNSPESDFFGSIWVANQEKHGYNTNADGEIWRLIPELDYAREGNGGHRPPRPRGGESKPNGGGQPPQGGQAPQGGQPPQGGKKEPPRGGQPGHMPAENGSGFEVIFRPTVAPDGMVYITDNGISYGGVFVMDPHTKQITNFFEGCEYANGEWTKGSDVVGSGSTGAHIYWTEDGNNKNGFNPESAKLYLMHNTHPVGADSRGVSKGFFVYDLMNSNELLQLTDLQRYANQEDLINRNLTTYENADVTDYAIAGTSKGAWVCQMRKDKGNFISHPSLTFYPNEGNPTIFSKSLDPTVGGIFGDDELIHGSFGSAIAVNKAENLLAMVGGTGNIMLFDITWNGSVPTLTNKRDYPIVADDPNTTSEWDIPAITTLNFDYAGNLVATIGNTYNDANDQHMVTIYTLPKIPNEINVPSRYSQRVPSLVEDELCTSIAKADTKYETVEVYRYLQAGMYNTICLPFALDLTSLSKDHPYYGADVVEFIGTEVKTGEEEILQLNFTEVTTMQAGVPYLIKPLRDIVKPAIFEEVSTNDVNAQRIEKGGVTFIGIFGPTILEASNACLILVANNRLAIPMATGELLGNRGYFEINNPQNMPKRSVISIKQSTAAGNNYIYHTSSESYKILEDGMIRIIRGGVKYDLLGARVQ